MSSLKRVSISLPSQIADDLDYIAKRLGISRSAFVAQVLTQTNLPSVRALLANTPEQPSEADTRRFRGESKKFVEVQLTRLEKLQGGLFDDSKG
jgi:predicted transcriptional regulator